MSESLCDKYFSAHSKYVTKYGDKTLVLMEVGSFYEAYATDTVGCNMAIISNLLNINYTKKNKKIEVSDKNPYLLGFPTVALSKFLRILINDGYTVIKMDQVGPKSSMDRVLTQIYSPGTFVDESLTSDSNNLLSVFIEEVGNMYCIGITVMDLTTGSSYLYESYSKKNDITLPLDDIVRFINSYKPSEILISRLNPIMDKGKLLDYLELSNRRVHYEDKIPKKKFSTTYISNFLKRVFPRVSENIIDYLDLSQLGYATSSLIFSLEFAFEHSESLIQSICKPVIVYDHNYLVLGNNAISQLNVLDGNTLDRFDSLFSVINNTSTTMGKRFLKNELVNPIVNEKELNSRYNMISSMLKDEYYLEIETFLKKINDTERLSRKLCIGKISPYEFYLLVESCETISRIFDNLKKNKKNIFLPPVKIINMVTVFLKKVHSTFLVEEMKKFGNEDITNSIFVPGVYPDIDKLQSNLLNNVSSVESLAAELSTKFPKIKNGTLPVKVMKNDKDGYHLQVSKGRQVLIDQLLTAGITVNGITYTDAHFISKELGSAVKYLFKNSNKSFSNYDTEKMQVELSYIIKTQCSSIFREISNLYSDMFQSLSYFIAKIDFYKSGAKTANLYNYCKPVIVKKDASYIDCKQLRHPIIERIRKDTEYVPHDISLGEDNKLNGMLIYGLNSSGKSSLMKSVGLSVILAQIGYYVPAISYTFSPYSSMFARITGNDNIFKGLSSFALEMTELRAILERSTQTTLVIGDEVCRGTEHISGNAIVASTIIKLASTKCSFLFATHLHEIANMKRIIDLKNVKSFHLTVQYDEKADVLIYDRILRPGPGEPIYGYIVARYIINDIDFMKNVQEIKNELLDMPNKVIHDKKSKYNATLNMSECQVCGKSYNEDKLGKNVGNLDTHHINFQSECKNGFVIKKKHVKMNSKSNLVVLCKECHYNVHHDKLVINGYKDTSKGISLDFSFI